MILENLLMKNVRSYLEESCTIHSYLSVPSERSPPVQWTNARQIKDITNRGHTNALLHFFVPLSQHVSMFFFFLTCASK